MVTSPRALVDPPIRAPGAEIIDSIDLPILIVAPDCTVASFNQSAAVFFSLAPSDVGRSLREIPVLSGVKRLAELCGDAVTRGVSSQGEVRDATGSWFVLRIAPCKGNDQQIAGAVLTLTNVTAFRESLEQAVREREYTKSIINTVIDPLIVLDEDLQIQTANQAFYAMFQVSREEIRGVRLYELANADWTAQLRSLVKDSRSANGHFEAVEVEHKFPTVGRRTLLLNARRLSRPGTLGQMTLLAIQDITERKRAEDAVRRRTAQFETLLNEAPLGVYLVDGDFRICEVNPAARPVFGNIPDLIGRDFEEVIHILWPKERADAVVQQFRHTLETGEPYIMPEWSEERVDRGGREYYEWQVYRIQLMEGRLGVVCYFRDISRQVQARQALAESADRLRFMAESMPQKIFTAKPSGDLDYFNQQWTGFTGLPFAQIKGSGWKIFIHPDDREENVRKWQHSIDTGEAFQFEHRFRRRDGEYRWHLSRAHALRDAEGKVLMWIGSSTDIEDQKRAEEKLEKTVRDRTASLQESIAELEHFSYTITHDMRAPLRAMQGFGTMLLNESGDRLTPQSGDYLKRIINAAERMDALTQDALQYSKIVRGEIPLAPVEPSVILRGILESYPTLQPPHADIRILDPLPPVVANEAGLNQCFSNLLGNAVKFVAPGIKPQIRVWAEIVPASGAGNSPLSTINSDGQSGSDLSAQSVRLWFEDNGIGILPKHQDRIFGMFQQLDKSYEGTGIGLALVRKVAERMGGKVGVQSEPGKGSRFWLEFTHA